MTTFLRSLCAAALAAFALAGCVVYDYPPPASPVSSFDRSWSAAVNAMHDAGVTVSNMDRTGGVITGTKSGSDVTARIRPQADGTVRVEFNARGGANDAAIANSVTSAYQAQMGRY